ncbi:MAG TPA: HNH endonuclease [Gemmatimonadaceae bacterium]|nr:HNH endonuclease [Gemmatimonadaceae bacterium]
MDDLDARVRVAAFTFLDEQTRLVPEDGALLRQTLVQGFVFEGQRVPLMGPQGIFKPRVLKEIPLSITTVPVVQGEERPYDDAVGPDGLLRYRYRGADPAHHENVGLRLAMQRRVPLVYFHGIVPGLYVAEWPVFIVGDQPAELTFTVSVEERRFAAMADLPVETTETQIRRRYATRLFRQRLHQKEFRERVVHAYQHHCAICRLRRNELLEAAHIVPDSDEFGAPEVPNGLALCRLHHAAFDAHLIGITPDYLVHVRQDVLDEKDGPMLVHGLQGFHGARLWVPGQASSQPSRDRLQQRYLRFLKTA